MLHFLTQHVEVVLLKRYLILSLQISSMNVKRIHSSLTNRSKFTSGYMTRNCDFPLFAAKDIAFIISFHLLIDMGTRLSHLILAAGRHLLFTNLPYPLQMAEIKNAEMQIPLQKETHF